MKTATITWIKYNNFGTTLQAYALQKTLLNHGVENDLISDDFIYSKNFQQNKQPTTAIANINFKYHLKRFGRAILLLFSKKRRETRKRNLALDKKIANFNNSVNTVFAGFKADFLKIRYIDANEKITDLNLDYDVFIAGSDQTWSPLSFNPYYYLDFASKKKIAYATSIGVNHLPEEIIPDISMLISNFHSIAVREKNAKDELQSLYQNEIKVVLDPTLLLTKKEWLNIATLPECNDYVLCYFLEAHPWYYDYAKQMAFMLKKRIILIPSRVEHLSCNFVYEQYVDPRGFIGLINNSSLIITDSYHGLIFSTILEKNFVLIKRFEDSSDINQNSRIFNLLNTIKLANNYITQKNAEISDICYPDYNEVNSILFQKRKDSINYIKEALDIK